MTQAAAYDVSPHRTLLAHAYLRGEGIEIGALHNPLVVPEHVRVRYLDRMPVQELHEHYPDIRIADFVPVDIIDDGETLRTIPDASQDFLIANHFLEHCEDPIGTCKNFFRVLRPNGIAYIAVPDKRYTFDCNRPLTPLTHLILDHAKGPEIARAEHYREWVTIKENITDPTEMALRVEHLQSMRYSIHFHVWTDREIAEFFRYLQSLLPFQQCEFLAEGNECILILRKNG